MEFLERLNFYQVSYFMYLESILPDRYIRLKPLLITSLYPFGWEIVVWNLWRLHGRSYFYIYNAYIFGFKGLFGFLIDWTGYLMSHILYIILTQLPHW